MLRHLPYVSQTKEEKKNLWFFTLGNKREIFTHLPTSRVDEDEGKEAALVNIDCLSIFLHEFSPFPPQFFFLFFLDEKKNHIKYFSFSFLFSPPPPPPPPHI